MTKKVKISFLILVWSIVAVQMYVNYQDREKQSLAVTAFSVVDENITGETIRGYGFFGTLDISEDMKKNMLKNLALKMGIKEGYSISKGQGDNFEKMILKKDEENTSTQLQLISVLGEEETEQYISIEVNNSTEVEDAFVEYENIKRFFEEIGVDGQVSLEVEMEKEGYMEEKEKDSYVKKIFDQTGAKVVDTIHENDIDTVYGYTRAENVYMKLKNKRINVQMIFTYDETQDKTYIKAGVPIVNSSY